ncbi:MAG: DUF2510 domain-containing protein [Actinobacteria bacterium]|nr:DUF2510 domain-containing protein [Actinomycetota bacterium]
MYGDVNPGPQFRPAPQNTDAGWYPDPHVGGTMRYWDGQAWSEHTATGYDHPAPSSVYAPYQRTYTSRPKVGFAEANQQSLVAIGFAVGYLVLAQVAGVVLLGVIPAMAGVRALQRREPLAPVAMAVAVGAVLLGLAAMGPR